MLRVAGRLVPGLRKVGKDEQLFNLFYFLSKLWNYTRKEIPNIASAH